MKPAAFEYHAPSTVEEVVDLLAEHGDEAKLLAGGQSLVPLMSLRLSQPEHLIDINGVAELSSVNCTDGRVAIGSITRQRQVETSHEVARVAPVLPAALRHIGHATIRNRGTVGGSIAHADPSSELPAMLLATDGAVIARSSSGSRTIPAADLFENFLTTTIEPTELITTVVVPCSPAKTGWSVREFSRRSGDFAIVGAVAGISLDQAHTTVTHASISLFGVGSKPVRAAVAEKEILGQTASPSLWDDAAAAAASEIDPPSDVHGSAAYRRQLMKTVLRQCLTEAYDRSGVSR
ncbi:xanthine dehydrogenase family protein subunit M [Gordonia sp. HNM0687]|uniref:Xanthine dehydrogenase family protein subunit M n=1 Tax=Gordonia mangrovi TaxID=2665643 RepID=A0A6L7GVA1_9ACTN|nr:xanthine dehydrogenase family protein subunit M [Gordonia mangrovi]MXP23412.1 xanthine dehydrogenase family protein subunit M [Gordonia mangrovi]UVF76686.1 xanthine dehydrogenase family protein subunit M [Gordonia mangrovi]